MCMTYGYIRVSTETQAEKGGGLAVQRESLVKYAKEHGITIDRIFEDAGISGTSESRPALDEMLILLKEGDSILVHTTSRLWRSIFAQAYVMKAVMTAKANIISIDEPSFDVYRFMNDPEQFMITGMLGLLDQWERMTIARKLARGRATKARQGDKPAGVAPYGYRYSEDKKHMEIDATESVNVKKMFNLAQAGRSLNKIAGELNEAGITTRQGKKWSAGSIQVILRNRFYVGELTHGGRVIEGKHKPLISKVQFGKVSSQLEQKRKH